MKFLHPNQGRFEGFWLAQLLGLFLLLLSFVLIANDSQSIVFSEPGLGRHVRRPRSGARPSARNLIHFALAMALLHALFGAGCWVVGRLSARAWSSPRVTLRQHVTVWFLALTIGLLANNAATFPKSSLDMPYAEPMGVLLLGVPLGRALLGAALLGVAVTVAVALTRWWQAGGRPTRSSYATFERIGSDMPRRVGSLAFFPRGTSRPEHQPHIILIGLDSLRADLLDPQISPGVTPHIDAFMDQGVEFTNAITPLARTFPSMMAMLTGRHPHQTGAVMNLLPRDQIHDRSLCREFWRVPAIAPSTQRTRCASRISTPAMDSIRRSIRPSAPLNS